METLLPPSATSVQWSATVTGKNTRGSVCSEGISCDSARVHCLWFCHWAPVKTAWLCPLCAHSQVFIHIDQISLNLPFSRLRSPNSLRLSSWDRYSSPIIIFMAPSWTLSSLTCNEQPRTEHSTPGVVSSVLRGRIPSLLLLAILCLMKLRRPSRRSCVASAAWAVSCLAHVQHGNPQDPQVLFYQGNFQLVTSQVCFFLNLMRFLSAHFCSLLSPLRRAKWPSGLSRVPSPFGIISKLAKGTLCPIIQIINEVIKL